jgi:hypothetical protein
MDITQTARKSCLHHCSATDPSGDFRQFAGRTTDKIDTTDTIVKLKQGQWTPRIRRLQGVRVDAFLSSRLVRALRYAVMAGVTFVVALTTNLDIVRAQFIGAQFIAPNTVSDAGATATGINSEAMGTNATASGDESLAVGFTATASGSDSTALGDLASATGVDTTAVGQVARALADNASAFGANSTANAINSSAFGVGTTATGQSSSAFGAFANASGQNSSAFGVTATASGANAMALGAASTASGTGATAAGVSADATQTNASAFGIDAQATGVNSTAAGAGAQATATDSSAFGVLATATGINSTAIGRDTAAAFSDSTAIGANATTTRANQMAFGTSTNTYTAAGITSAASKAAQTGTTQLVTSDASGNLATANVSIEDLHSDVRDNGEGVAMALAMAGTVSVLPDNKAVAVSANWGQFESQAAGAITGVARLQGDVFMNAGFGFSQNTTGGRAGLTFAW